MAIDPRISMGVQATNVLPAIDIFNSTLQQQRQNSIQDQLLAGQLAQQQQQLQRGAIDLSNTEDARDLKSIAEFATTNVPAMQSAIEGDSLPLQQSLANRIRNLQSQGRDTSQSMEALQMIQSGDVQSAVSSLSAAQQLASNSGLLGGQVSAGQRERDQLIRDSKSDDEDIANSALIKLGLKPRATGSAAQTIAQSGNVEDVAEVESRISGAREGGKLKEKIKLEPELKRAVTAVTAQVKNVADSLTKNKSNNSALKVYETGIESLRNSLGDTSTGPLVGLLPAFTTSAQVAEGASSMMAPVLKQMFRSSGEGTFTDSDQKLLMNMIPKRTDTAEAIKSKLEFLDNMVNAKLGVNTQADNIESAVGGLTANPQAQQIDIGSMSDDDLIGSF